MGARFIAARPLTQLHWTGHDDPEVVIVGDRTGALKALFDAHAESVLFLRPDRCIAGACIAQLAPELSTALFDVLCLTKGGDGLSMSPEKPMALCCMSHSPLLNLPGPSPELLDDIDSALTDAREFVREFDPELVVIFSPDHYNGFFYRLMPPFCIGTAAIGRRRLRDSRRTAERPRRHRDRSARSRCGTPVSTWRSRRAWTSTTARSNRCEILFGAADSVPVIPIFINSVATPLGPIKRASALGAAVGDFVATLDKRVLVVGSGGLSHDPPVPTLATAPPAAFGRIVHGAADLRANSARPGRPR